MTADALKKLGKYEIRGTLGKGAMGIVYDGFDPIIERRVAIKTIAKAAIEPNETAELLGRFKREAQAAGRLSHPGVVSIHDYGEDDHLAFIAMEFINGSDLWKYFQSQQRFELKLIVRIMCDILDALDHAHRNGVVHRDIKPSNIMITDEGRVKVADFGVAWIESSTMTQIGMRMGTPAYMSPEQHQGLPISGRSDLFSAGVILYEFLTRERPFSGDGYNLIRQILLQDPVLPSQLNFDVPPALDAVTMRALAKRPQDRFATAREFAAALREAAGSQSVVPGIDFELNDGPSAVDGSAAIPLPPGLSRETVPTGASSINSSSNPSEVALEAELEYWKEIKDSTEAVDFDTFLRVFPESRFAPLARRRMSRLQAEAKVGRHAIGERQRAPENRARIEVERAPDQVDWQPQREDEKTLLLAEAATRSPMDDHGADNVAEGGRKAEARERAEAPTERRRDVDWRLPRLDAEEPKLTLPPMPTAHDRMAPVDLSPHIAQQSDPTVATAHFKRVNGPVHARGNTKFAQPQPVHEHSLGAGASRRSRRLWIAAAVAAVLVGSGLWYATRPESAETVAMLPAEPRAIMDHIRQLWHSHQAPPAQQERTNDEAARLAEDRRRNEQALEAERNRQLALARQKEEAARAAVTQDFQRAITLLNEGRHTEGVRLLRHLANNGHGAAARTLGDLYATGEGVLLDRKEALHFYAIAERNGVALDPPASRRR